MILYKRFIGLFATLTLVITVLILRSHDGLSNETRSRIWRHLPLQKIGLGDWLPTEYDDERPSDLRIDQNDGSAVEQLGEGQGDVITYKPGQVKSPGSAYTRAVVMGRLMAENISWIDEADLAFAGINTYIYVVDDVGGNALLRTPKNKGHEGMVYLSYIIDHYDELDDVSIFLHAHKMAWHNNELLNHDAVEMIKRLSAERVQREGYMNMRCHWKPGCPEWVHPGVIGTPDINRPEEGAMANAWVELFPFDPIPASVAGACCAQFAVSRDRIWQIPRQRFIHYRDWLLNTDLPDQTSGRVFEYLWGKIFTGNSTFCPDQRICYCDGYGVCFENEKEFDYWFELSYKRAKLQEQLEEWQFKVERLSKAREQWSPTVLDAQDLEIPPVDYDVQLQSQIDGLMRDLEKRRHAALKLGTDPRVRARVAGREWSEGDGF